MECLAVAYDTPIPGYGTKNCANIRLWSAKPVAGFDLNSFNAGNYEASVHASSEVGNIVSHMPTAYVKMHAARERTLGRALRRRANEQLQRRGRRV